MVKDPLDNGRTQDMFPDEPTEFTPSADEKIAELITSIPEATPGQTVEVSGSNANDGVYEVAKEEPKFPPPSAETLAAIAAALDEIQGRSFSARHPELGKMKKCFVCGLRHRVNERKCEQVFTYQIGGKHGYEQFREDENGELVPNRRTAIPVNSKPTMKQIMGAAATAKRRFHPHPSKIKLQFIERTRKVFSEVGFYLLDVQSDKFKELTPDVQKLVLADFQSDLQRARVIAARQIRAERELSDREIRRRQDQSRRINRGLRVTERA